MCFKKKSLQILISILKPLIFLNFLELYLKFLFLRELADGWTDQGYFFKTKLRFHLFFLEILKKSL